jgi:hypothetical protein
MGSTPKRISQLNSKQWSALQRGLALQHADRTPSVEEFLRELRPATDQRIWPLGIAGIVALATVVWLVWVTLPEQAPERSPPPETVVVPKPPPPEMPFSMGTSTDSSLRIWTAASEYRIGDNLQFQFAITKPLYLRIFYSNSSGEQGILYPTNSMPDRRLEPGTYQFPFPEADFTLDITGPQGIDRVIVVASERPVPSNLVVFDENGKLIEQIRASWPTVAELSYRVR